MVLANEIAPCVHHIFSLSLHTATVPTEWNSKSATVRPIYKERGSKQVATNYRPISLLSTLSKCLEKLIFRRLYSHLDPFLPSHQSGFRQKDSTAYQLARLIHRLASALDEGHTTLACFYDLSTAFDRVWHRSLLALSSTTSVYEAKPTPGLQTLSPTAANVSDSMAATHLGLQYLLVCPRVLCLALFSSWPTQLTCRTAWQFPQAATSLQTTPP